MKYTKYYICKYCYKEYIPKRRGVQKYCSNSCRSNACRVRNSDNNQTNSLSVIDNKVPRQSKMAGVGNATAGYLIAEGVIALLKKEDNKAATKGDLKLLTEKLLGRYHLVKNFSPNINGELPYFDLVTQEIVYYK